MIARLQKSMKEKDQGFTLIELLVVIVIIGILAAIAIPLFLNQRKKGVDSSLKSDLKSAATTVETALVDANAVTAGSVSNPPATTPVPGSLNGMKASDGNTVTLVASTGTPGAYCVFAYNSGASAATGTGAQMAYLSKSGGLQSTIATDSACA